MLDIARVDLGYIAEALEDHSLETGWWFDPRTGEVEPWPLYDGEEPDEKDPEGRGLIPVATMDSQEGYRDMEDFIARVEDPRARDLLERAIGGRGAFRRFKDTLFEFPQLREAWFRFHDVRMERRALEWLSDEGLVDAPVLEKELEARSDPDLPGLTQKGRLDPYEIAAAVGRDLVALYGDRLNRVLLFGSWARRDAHPESDIDLLVVLDAMESPWAELRRMDPILWRYSFEHETVVTALPVTDSDFAETRWPLLRRVRAEAQRVA